MQAIRRFLFKEHNLVFMFCLAVVAGPAISILFVYDLSLYPDTDTYLGLATFDFDQSPVRRFRLLIPLAATCIDKATFGFFNVLAPAYFKRDFSLPFSFFLVNTSLMAYFGVLIYRYCRAYGLSVLLSLLALLVMLTCRYTPYLAALPIVDSLFCVVVAMTLTGIREQNTKMLIAAIFIGPFAKESFVFIAPLIFFYSHLDKKKQVGYFLLSGACVFLYRYIYQQLAPTNGVDSLTTDMNHLYNVPVFLKSLISFSGVYKIVSNLFFWLLVPIAAYLFIPGYFKRFFSRVDWLIVWFFVSVLVQMLLSGSLERMFYISMPVLCLWVGLSANELKKQYMSAEK
ncbi:hypothetical protein CAP35_01475 [Chitinophagaceae bacterium IBVUCB1]|nr:hypothetical protein CAP35_01475 [Chitinophagaceae bacterium IBVUCB1]